MIDKVEHKIDAELVTESEDEIKVCGYMTTQYNLKTGLKKFGEKVTLTAMEELTQLHIMDTWKAMDLTELN